MRAVKKPFLIFSVLIIVSAALMVVTMGSLGEDRKVTHKSDTYPLDIKIKPRKDTYKKSEYVLLDVSAKNVSNFDISTPWGTCADRLPIVLDGEHELFQYSGIMCSVGWPEMSPGQEYSSRVIELDLSHLESGKHTLHAVYNFLGPQGTELAISDAITVNITPAEDIYDCINYMDDVTTICQQEMVRARFNKSDSENNKTCEYIRDNILAKSYPLVKPIPSYSTNNCNSGEPAVFVFNLPKNRQSRFEGTAKKKINSSVCNSTQYSRQWLETPKYDSFSCSF